MQARTWTRRFEPGQFKLILAALVAIGILLLGAVLATTLSSGDQAASIDRPRIDLARPTPNTRFLERNILPGDPGTYPVTSPREYRHRLFTHPPDSAPATSLQEYRFRDWNILPGDDVPVVPPAHERGDRY